VVVVGDGAVGLLGVLSARQDAGRIIAMKPPVAAKLAREFGATDIVTERGDQLAGPHQGADQGMAPIRF
jgi:threonine dehydrogenase-like Zn-dependent dehydrogenase